MEVDMFKKFQISLVFSMLLSSVFVYAENPEIILKNEKAKKLFSALNIKEKNYSREFLIFRTKEIKGALVCSQIKTEYTDPILPQTSSYECTISENLTSSQVREIFKKLNILQVPVGVGIEVEIKYVAGLIFKKFRKTYSLLTNEACENVTNLESAKQCLNFWGKEVYHAYEDSVNPVGVSKTKSSFNALKELLENKYVEDRQYYEDEEREDYDKTYRSRFAQLDAADYVGVLWQVLYVGGELTYFTIQNGRDVIPQAIHIIDLEDSESIPEKSRNVDLLSLRLDDIADWDYELLKETLE